MELANEAALTSRKGFYWLWWSYLRLAHELAEKDRSVANALLASRDFYQSWQLDKPEYANSFGRWWKDKEVLFQERYQVRLLRHGEKPADSEAIVIEVPLRFSASKLNKAIRNIIDRSLSEQSTHRKSRKKSSAAYSLSSGAEPKYLALRDMMLVYRDVQLRNRLLKLTEKQTKVLKGTQLLEAVNNSFLNRRKPHNKVPMTLQITYVRDPKSRVLTKTASQVDNLNALRSLNRYIHKAETVILNVAKGEFPGHY